MSIGRFSFIFAYLFLLYANNLPAQDTYFDLDEGADNGQNEVIKVLKAEYGKVTKTSNSGRVNTAYQKQLNSVLKLVRAGGFIQNDSIAKEITALANQIINNNNLERDPPNILIGRNHSANAYTIGFNSIIFNIGLLARIQNQEELEFILAHEMAHIQLDHVKKGIERNILVKKEVKKNNRTSTNKNMLISASQIVNLKSLYYQSGEIRRNREAEADSLGFIYFIKGKKSPEQGLSALDILANSNKPKYPRGELLLEPLHSPEYPIQGQWLRGRPKGYDMKRSQFLFFNLDSLQSHPDIDYRKEMLLKNFGSTDGSDSQYINATPIPYKLAEKETLDAAIFMGKYDQALHLALQFKWRYPNDDWPNSAVVNILMKISDAKKDGVAYKYIQDYTAYYSDELKDLNLVLYNMTSYEAMEMAYYFFKNPNNFNAKNDNHLYLKWQVSKLTGRKKEAQKYLNLLKADFPKSQFLNR